MPRKETTEEWRRRMQASINSHTKANAGDDTSAHTDGDKGLTTRSWEEVKQELPDLPGVAEFNEDYKDFLVSLTTQQKIAQGFFLFHRQVFTFVQQKRQARYSGAEVIFGSRSWRAGFRRSRTYVWTAKESRKYCRFMQLVVRSDGTWEATLRDGRVFSAESKGVRLEGILYETDSKLAAKLLSSL